MSVTNTLIGPLKIISGGDMSGNLTSTPIQAKTCKFFSFQTVFTGAPTGTFALDGTNDDVTWTAITLSGVPAASGAGGNNMIFVGPLSFSQIRLRYVFTSGTGSLTVTAVGTGS